MASSSRKRFRPTGIGAALILVILVVVGVGIFLVDEENPLHDVRDVERDYRRRRRPMEVRGQWLGMYLAETRSNDARTLRVPPSVKGVVVTGLKEPEGERARRGGVGVGDVITGVDGKKVADLEDVFNATKKVDTNRPVMVDVLKGGQPATLVLPGAVALPMAPVAYSVPSPMPRPVAWAPGTNTRQVQWPLWSYGGASPFAYWPTAAQQTYPQYREPQQPYWPSSGGQPTPQYGAPRLGYVAPVPQPYATPQQLQQQPWWPAAAPRAYGAYQAAR